MKPVGEAEPTLADRRCGDAADGLRKGRRHEGEAGIGIELPQEAPCRRRRHRFEGGHGRERFRRRFVFRLDGRRWFGRKAGHDRDRGRGSRQRCFGAPSFGADDQEKEVLAAGRDPGDAGRPDTEARLDRTLEQGAVGAADFGDEGVDRGRGRGEGVEAARRPEDLPVTVENCDQAVVRRDGIRQPFGPGRQRFPGAAAGADRENGVAAAGEREPTAGGGQDDLPDAEIEPEHFEPVMVAGQLLRQPRELARQRARWREAAAEQRAHPRLAEEADAGGIRPQNPAAVAAEGEGRTRIEQHRTDGRLHRDVEIGVRLPVHDAPARPSKASTVAAILVLKKVLIQWDAGPVHATGAAPQKSFAPWLTPGRLAQASIRPILRSGKDGSREADRHAAHTLRYPRSNA